MSCSYCGQTFSRGDSLKRHVKDIHENTNEARVKCEKCLKDFKNMNSFTSHKARRCFPPIWIVLHLNWNRELQIDSVFICQVWNFIAFSATKLWAVSRPSIDTTEISMDLQRVRTVIFVTRLLRTKTHWSTTRLSTTRIRNLPSIEVCLILDFGCEMCQKYFSTSSSYKRHLRDYHSNTTEQVRKKLIFRFFHEILFSLTVSSVESHSERKVPWLTISLTDIGTWADTKPLVDCTYKTNCLHTCDYNKFQTEVISWQMSLVG